MPLVYSPVVVDFLDGNWKSYEDQVENVDGYCDLYSICNDEYDLVNSKYRRNVFIVASILGTLVFVGAIFIPITAISAGLMGGGILTLFFGIVQYWDKLHNFGRFIILGIVLAILIYIGIKKLK